MNNSLLIVITGKPGAGKTTLGRSLASRLELPFLHKDGIKEVLFDRLGSAEDNPGNILQFLSYDLLYFFLETTAKAKKSLIVESNFLDNFDTTKLTKLQQQYGLKIFQILCTVDNDIAFNRFAARTKSGERHPGHGDHKNIEKFQDALVEGREYKLNVDGQLFIQDMNDFTAIDHEKIVEAIKAYSNQ